MRAELTDADVATVAIATEADLIRVRQALRGVADTDGYSTGGSLGLGLHTTSSVP